MTNAQAKQLILGIARDAAETGNRDRAAKLEILAEYLTNPIFRRNMEDHIWEINHDAGDLARGILADGLVIAS